MLSDPLLSYNEATGCHRIVLVNGDPVEADDCGYACLSMLCEDPGWVMEEVPREGNLVEALSETTRRTRGDCKAAVEQRLRHLIDEQVLIDARCTDIDVYDVESGGRGIAFGATIQKPGQSPRSIQGALRGT